MQKSTKFRSLIALYQYIIFYIFVKRILKQIYWDFKVLLNKKSIYKIIKKYLKDIAI